jgi:hypothetical protein
VVVVAVAVGGWYGGVRDRGGENLSGQALPAFTEPTRVRLPHKDKTRQWMARTTRPLPEASSREAVRAREAGC